MNLKQLEYVTEVSKCGSINKAAQNLYVSQSSVSAAIKQLEQELNFSIFRRKNSGIELTSEGRILLSSAKLILDEADRIRRIPTLFDSQRNLSISCTWSSLLMHGFMQFRNENPEEHVQDSFKESNFYQTIQDVIDQNYRLSIASCLDSRKELHRQNLDKYHIAMEPLATNIPSVAFLSKNHSLSRFPHLTMNQLRSCMIVSYDILNSDDWLGAFELNDADVLNIFDRGGMLDAVQHNYVAVIPYDPEMERGMPNAVMRPISDGPLSSIYLLSHRAYTLNPREKKFITDIRQRLRGAYGKGR